MVNLIHFRPRQAAQGGSSVSAGASAYPTVGFYNPGNSPTYLVGRYFVYTAGTRGGGSMHAVQGLRGSTPLPAAPLFANEHLPNGQIISSADSGQIDNTGNFDVGAEVQFTWNLNVPFVVLPPGWGWYMQRNSNSDYAVGWFLWEELLPEQLDADSFLRTTADLLLRNS